MYAMNVISTILRRRGSLSALVSSYLSKIIIYGINRMPLILEQPSYLRQPTPVATASHSVAQQNIQKAVAAAQWKGKHFKNN